MSKTSALAALAAAVGCTLALSLPSLAAPKFAPVAASARIDTEGAFVRVCTTEGGAEVCKRAYTRAKNRTAGPRFSKIKSGKNTFKAENRYWTTCDVYGLCTTVYAGDGG